MARKPERNHEAYQKSGRFPHKSYDRLNEYYNMDEQTTTIK